MSVPRGSTRGFPEICGKVQEKIFSPQLAALHFTSSMFGLCRSYPGIIKDFDRDISE